MQSLPRYFSEWSFHLQTPHGLLPVPPAMHLWFLQYLFIISLASLPLFLLLQTKPARRGIARLAGWAVRPGGLFLLAIPAALVLVFFPQAGTGSTHTWADFIWYAAFFVTGFVLAADKRFTVSIKKHGWVNLGLWTALLAFGGFFPSVFGDDAIREGGWFAVIFMLFLGAEYIDFNNKVLSYANEAVLPFYLLHHTIIVCVGWFVIRWNMGIVPKFLIVVVVSFPLMLLVYDRLVRRSNVVRFFFGMRPRKRPMAIPAADSEGTAP